MTALPSLHNACNGVPAPLACPILLGDTELLQLIYKTGAMSVVPVEAVDKLITMARKTDTSDLYSTNGQVEGNVLTEERGDWVPTKKHEFFLRLIAESCKVSLDTVTRIDKTIHIKRARALKDVNTPKAAMVVNNRIFFYYLCSNESTKRSNQHLAAWFDISPSPHAPRQHAFELPSEIKTRTNASESVISTTLQDGRVPRECIMCKKTDNKTKKHLRCGQCLGVSYCSRVCQKNHWNGGHNTQCKTYNPGKKKKKNK